MEINESKFRRRKYNRWDPLEGGWIVSMVDRNSGSTAEKGFLKKKPFSAEKQFFRRIYTLMVSIFSYDCDLFKTIESSLEYLLDHEIISPQRQCRKCDHISRITIYKCNNKQRIIYRCTNILYKNKNQS